MKILIAVVQPYSRLSGSLTLAGKAGERANQRFPLPFVRPTYRLATDSSERFLAINAKSAFCGSANFLIPSLISVSSRCLMSTSLSISANTAASGSLSTWRVKVCPLFCTASFVAGGFVSMSLPANAATYFHAGSEAFLVPVLAKIISWASGVLWPAQNF